SGNSFILSADTRTGRTDTLWEGRSTIDFLTSVSSERIVALYTDAATPPDLVAFNARLLKQQRLTHVNPGLDRVPGNKTVTFTTRVPSYDGSMRTLETAVILPVGYRREHPPAALVRVYPDNRMSNYAGVFGAGRLSGAELAQLWTTRGYAVVLPDLLPL